MTTKELLDGIEKGKLDGWVNDDSIVKIQHNRYITFHDPITNTNDWFIMVVEPITQ